MSTGLITAARVLDTSSPLGLCVFYQRLLIRLTQNLNRITVSQRWKSLLLRSRFRHWREACKLLPLSVCRCILVLVILAGLHQVDNSMGIYQLPLGHSRGEQSQKLGVGAIYTTH